MFIARESQYRTEPYDNKHHNKETLYRSTALSQHRGISPIVVSSSAIRDEILNFDHPRTRVDPERFWHRKRPWAVEGIEKITWNTKRSVLYCIPTGVERNGLSFGRFIIIFFKKTGLEHVKFVINVMCVCCFVWNFSLFLHCMNVRCTYWHSILLALGFDACVRALMAYWKIYSNKSCKDIMLH